MERQKYTVKIQVINENGDAVLTESVVVSVREGSRTGTIAAKDAGRIGATRLARRFENQSDSEWLDILAASAKARRGAK